MVVTFPPNFMPIGGAGIHHEPRETAPGRLLVGEGLRDFLTFHLCWSPREHENSERRSCREITDDLA